MNASRDVVFIIALNSLPSGGTITRAACGSTIRRIARPCVIPSERAASSWPLSIASIPARMISRMNAPSLIARAMIPAKAAPSRLKSPRWTVFGITVKPKSRFVPK